MVRISQLGKKELLSRAKKHIFFTGLMDGASALCRENMSYGLAKMHLLQEHLGFQPNATFVSAPDATISRNTHRWGAGISYGGKITWGEKKDPPFVILNVMPNACGMVAGGINEIPEAGDLIKKVHQVNETEAPEIDGIPIKWDFNAGNHFIDLFDVKKIANFPFDYDHAVVIHGSAPEFKGDNDKFGFGLYYHRSKILQEVAETFDTPFGTYNYLLDSDATKYFELCKYAEEFSCRKRELALDLIFGKDSWKIITNKTHQGLTRSNQIVLGTHDTTNASSDDLFPLALRGDLPMYLLNAKPCLTEEIIDNLGFMNRAEKFNTLHRITRANLLPHGGGYAFPDMLGIKEVIELEGMRYYSCEMSSMDEVVKVFSNPRELEFCYRGRQVVSRTLELRMGRTAAKLIPRMVIKV